MVDGGRRSAYPRARQTPAELELPGRLGWPKMPKPWSVLGTWGPKRICGSGNPCPDFTGLHAQNWIPTALLNLNDNIQIQISCMLKLCAWGSPERRGWDKYSVYECFMRGSWVGDTWLTQHQRCVYAQIVSKCNLFWYKCRSNLL